MVEMQPTLTREAERTSVTHEWVSAQVKGNAWAGIGVACIMSVATMAPAMIMGWNNDTLILLGVMSVASGIFYFGWLSWRRFSLDEWIESAERADIMQKANRVPALESQVANLRKRNTELADRNRTLETRLQERRPVVREVEQKTTAPKKSLPRNVEAANTIVQQWFLDPDPDHTMASRANLMRMGNLTREEVEAGWRLLEGLNVAGKNGEHQSAKWVITEADESLIKDKIQDYLAISPAGDVRAY